MQMSMFSSEGPPAKIIRSRDSVLEWLAAEVRLPLHLLKLLRDTAPDLLSGKMSAAFSQATSDEPLRDFWAISAARQSQSPMGGGVMPELLRASQTLTASHIVCSIHSMPEWTATLAPFPSDGSVCSLSDILETGDHLRRLSLIPKACAGILRRAERQGKVIPEPLRSALGAVASQEALT